MYLILNKENDYKRSISKIQALELSYKGIVKLISNKEGNLTENMLLNIKSKQDSTYAKLTQFYTEMNNFFSVSGVTNKTFEYFALNPTELRPYELGFTNYVDNKLLTNIMKNEVKFKEYDLNVKNDFNTFSSNAVKSKLAATNLVGTDLRSRLRILRIAMHPNSTHAAMLLMDDVLSGNTYDNKVYLKIHNFKNAKQEKFDNWSSYIDGYAGYEYLSIGDTTLSILGGQANIDSLLASSYLYWSDNNTVVAYFKDRTNWSRGQIIRPLNQSLPLFTNSSLNVINGNYSKRATN